MTKHNAKAVEIRRNTRSLRAALEERAKILRRIKDDCTPGSSNYRCISKELSETEDLIQELDRAIDGVDYNG